MVMRVGLSLPQAPHDGDAATWTGILGLATQAEAGGADSLWVCDHFLDRPADGGEAGYHEPFTLLAALAASTRRVEVGTLVAATSFRSAGLLAKIAATVDLVAGGRLILGLGCGWHEPEYLAFGYPFDHRVGRFEEVIGVLRPLLDGERVTYDGRWMHLDDAVILPRPAGSIPIVVAAEGPRMVELAARHADGWQTAWHGLPDDDYRAGRDALGDACERAGRVTPPAIFVGIEVDPGPGLDDRAVRLDPSAIADALAAWDAEAVAHVQLAVFPATRDTFAVALAGIEQFHAGLAAR
jgi:alkanesulfonate monooxygenase SsuD/methylene tetrahydromethanopterin reductase-like flavin-dependent oxidoreductase (luciferase family)